MKTKTAWKALLATALVSTAFAAEGSVPKGISDLDHVFLIMMENHGYGQIFNNPNAPFINQLAKSANYATNYFAVGHPSLTNYLEVVGGSNFGVRSDDYPDWHNKSCTPNLISGITTLRYPGRSPPSFARSGHRHRCGDARCRLHERGSRRPSRELPLGHRREKVHCGGPEYGRQDHRRSARRSTDAVGRATRKACRPAAPTWVNYSDGFFTNNTDFSTYALLVLVVEGARSNHSDDRDSGRRAGRYCLSCTRPSTTRSSTFETCRTAPTRATA